MAATRVQTTTGGTSSGSSFNLTAFGSNTTTGSTIIVSVMLGSTSRSVSSITDPQSNTYASALVRNGSGQRLEIWYASNITGGSTPQLTVNFAGGSTQGNAIAREYGGLATSSALDKTSVNSGTGGTATSNATATTTQNNELVVGGLTSVTNPSVGSGYGNYQELLSSGTTIYVALEDMDQTSTAAQTATFGGTSSNWAAGVATFKEGSSTSIKTVNGLANASVKTVNGLARASVKKWNGLS